MPSSFNFDDFKRYTQKAIATIMCSLVAWCPIGLDLANAHAASVNINAIGSAGPKDKKYDEMTEEEKAEYDAAQKAEADKSLEAGKEVIDVLQEAYENGKTSSYGPQYETEEEQKQRQEELRQTGKTASEIGKEYGSAAVSNLPTINGTTLSIPIFNQGKGETLTMDQNSLAPSSDTNSNIEYNSSLADINGQQANYNDGTKMNKLGSEAKSKLFELAGKDREMVGKNIEAEVFKLLQDTKGMSKQFDLDEDVLFTASNTILNNIGDAIGNIYNCKTETITHSYEETIKDEREYQCTQTVRHVGNCVLTHDFATDSWGSAECVEGAQMVEDGYAKGTVTCTQQVKDGDMVDGIKVVAAQFTGKPKVFKSITNLCKLASVTVDSSFSGDSAELDCYEHTVGVDDNGELVKETVCPGQNTGTNVDSCQRYVEQGCAFVKSECLDEMSGDSGNCYATELTYRCNNDPQTFLKESTETVTTCDGLTCYGDDCITSETSDNTDFEKAVALLDAATYMANDIECDANSIDNCKFLSGSGLECKIAVGGWQNCCDPNAKFGLRKFMKVVGTVLKVWSAVNSAYNTFYAGDTYIIDGKEVTQEDYNKWVSANGNTGELKWDENGNLIGGTGKYTVSEVDKYGWKFGETGSKTNMGAWITIGTDVTQVIKAYGQGSFLTEAFTSGISSITEFFKVMKWDQALKAKKADIAKQADNLLDSLKKSAADAFKNAFGMNWQDFTTKVSSAAAKIWQGFGSSSGQEGAANAMAGAAQEAAKDAATTAAKDASINAATDTAMTAAMEYAAAIMTVVAWIYLAYCIADMVISLVYACEDEEVELQAKLDQKICHYVGSYCKKKILKACLVKMKSYCCFSSPLARILNQEIRKQSSTGLNWGSPKHPDCAGIPVKALETVDWDKVDLSEWIGLMNTTDQMPNSSNVNMEERTGTGSALAKGEDREDSQERQTSKLDGADVDGLRKSAGTALMGNDFSKRWDLDENGDLKVDYDHDTCTGQCGETGGYIGELGSCVCYPDCNNIMYCQFGGSPYKNQYACYCYASPWCAGPDICPYGGTPKGDGSQDCECDPPPNCWDQCQYGGVAVGDGSQACTCNSKPTGMETCAAYCRTPGSPYHGDVDWNSRGYDMFCTVDGDNCHFSRKLWRKKKCIRKRVRAARRQAAKCNQIEGVQCTGAWQSHKHGVFGCNVQSTICTGTCEFGGIWNKTTHTCDCNPNICEDACDWNGVPVTNGTQACSCYPEPSDELQKCADACEEPNENSEAFNSEAHFRKDGYDLLCEVKGKDPTSNAAKADEIVRACKDIGLKCTFGWSDEKDGNGSGFFGCIDELSKCDSECMYGGVADDSGNCKCNEAPVCEGPKEKQTGTKYCPYGGKPYGNGTQDCACNQQPTCKSFCPYGGTPNADGTQACTCGVTKDCSVECKDFGGTFLNGVCDCVEEPDCNNECTYGGVAAKDGTDECNCYPEPVCSGAFGVQDGNNFCQFGGEAKGDDEAGNGTRDCVCREAPTCDSPTLCPYGGLPAGDGTDSCVCNPMPICQGPKDEQTGDNYCAYGGIAAANGTRACRCLEETNCNLATNCPYGGSPKGDGTGGCNCVSAPKCETQCPDWGGKPLGNGTQDCLCDGAPQCKTSCTYGGDVSRNPDGTMSGTCVCREAPDCSAAGICPYGGSPKGDGTQECRCNPAPICDKTVCPYGGEPAADGTQSCACQPAPNCNNSMVCPYGGNPKGNGTQACQCNDVPVCEGAKARQTGSNYCEYGGKPAKDGTNACICNKGSDCDECDLGGTPLKNGTQACTCTTDTSCQTTCAYGGEPKENGTTECYCYDAPNCNDTTVCLYGGEPKAGGTQECNCNAGPVCVGSKDKQTGTNFCKFGGTAKGNGTMYCVCNEAPKCGVEKCPYGGSPKADGTDACECKEAPDCTNATNCPFGGKPSANGTQACVCQEAPECVKQCPDYGGTPLKDGTQNCQCNEAPSCKDQCQYGGIAAVDGTTACICDPMPVCDVTSCLYGGGPKGDGTQECQCNEEPNCGFKCDFGGTPAADGTTDCVCNESPECNVPEKCLYGGTPKNDGTDACVCNAAPNCSTKCLYGGTPKANGSQECSCHGTDLCAAKCEYGGTPAKTPEEFKDDCNASCKYGGEVSSTTMNGVTTSSCTCKEAPICTGSKAEQTGLNYCTYGGQPAANGSQACSCNPKPTNCSVASVCKYGGSPKADGTDGCSCLAAPNCRTQCTDGFGGTPKADGTQNCNCRPAPDCYDIKNCAYGGNPLKDGTQNCGCFNPPDCSTEANCPAGYGGTPRADGTQACDCNDPPNCSAQCTYGGHSTKPNLTCVCNEAPDCTVYTVCQFGGQPTADGTQNCGCWDAPNCTTVCEFGGSPVGNGTQACSCWNPPNCNTAAVCPYGGQPNADGTQGCTCNEKPDCSAECEFGGTVKGNGQAGCACFSDPKCTTAAKCKYGGVPDNQVTNPTYVCTKATCPYGFVTDAEPNKCDASICPYGR